MIKTQITFISDPILKEKALVKTKKDGITLKALLTMAMRSYVDGELTLGLQTKQEEPTAYLLNSIQESEENLKKGDVSPSFSSSVEAIKWLKNQKHAS